MVYSLEWKTIPEGDASQFDQERSKIVKIYVVDEFVGGGEQSVFIDNFSVLGPWEKGPLQADKMPSFWLMANGLPVADGQADLDSDNDGAKNYSEYLAGTDPLDASSKFKVEIDKDQAGRPVLRWKHENYRAYDVLRTSDLTKPFNSVTVQVQRAGVSDEALAPAGSENTSFYKVQIGVKP
jgi:hypothetical protein